MMSENQLSEKDLHCIARQLQSAWYRLDLEGRWRDEEDTNDNQPARGTVGTATKGG
jgi:hypothetical protein